MTMLDISEAFQAEVRRVLAFASRPENHYLLHESEFEPGDRPEYVIESGTYRLVYTVTVAAGDRWRHLAVTLGKGRLPPPIVVFTAAHMLGFTGGKPDAQGLVEKPADGWEFKKSLETRTVTIIERI